MFEELYEYLLVFLHDHSYIFAFTFIFIISVIPILTPPTWMIIVLTLTLNNDLNPLILSAIGASGAIAGRLILFLVSGTGREIISNQRKDSLEILKKYIGKMKYGYFVGTLIFALLPLPSSMLFISYGLMKKRSLGIIIGFWIGRFIAYIIMIYLTKYILVSFNNIFDLDITSILLIDGVGIAMTICLLLIDWNVLINERRIVVRLPDKLKFKNQFRKDEKSDQR